LKVSEGLEDFITPHPYYLRGLRGSEIILNKNTGNIKKFKRRASEHQKRTFQLVRNLPVKRILWEKSVLFDHRLKRNFYPSRTPVPSEDFVLGQYTCGDAPPLFRTNRQLMKKTAGIALELAPH
jgi:hypothetical protein